MAIKLYYFDVPGRAESIRLIFAYGDVPFEDVRITRDQWLEKKPTTPFGHLPVIETEGVTIAETFALERFAAAKANLLPADPLKLAQAEQVTSAVLEAWRLFAPTYQLDPEAKIAARQELVKGAFTAKLQQIAKLLDGKKFFLGDELCYVDLSVFCALALLKAGFMDGVPASYLDDVPALKAHQAAVASLDKVKAYYAGKTGMYTSFQPEA